jgi:hypothetical protein
MRDDGGHSRFILSNQPPFRLVTSAGLCGWHGLPGGSAVLREEDMSKQSLKQQHSVAVYLQAALLYAQTGVLLDDV